MSDHFGAASHFASSQKLHRFETGTILVPTLVVLTTPWYTGGRQLAAEIVLAKEWDGPHGVVRFEYSILR